LALRQDKQRADESYCRSDLEPAGGESCRHEQCHRCQCDKNTKKADVVGRLITHDESDAPGEKHEGYGGRTQPTEKISTLGAVSESS
jgi:hypothetical protein